MVPRRPGWSLAPGQLHSAVDPSGLHAHVRTDAASDAKCAASCFQQIDVFLVQLPLMKIFLLLEVRRSSVERSELAVTNFEKSHVT